VHVAGDEESELGAAHPAAVRPRRLMAHQSQGEPCAVLQLSAQGLFAHHMVDEQLGH
jgi:hypothetical protein